MVLGYKPLSQTHQPLHHAVNQTSLSTDSGCCYFALKMFCKLPQGYQFQKLWNYEQETSFVREKKLMQTCQYRVVKHCGCKRARQCGLTGNGRSQASVRNMNCCFARCSATMATTKLFIVLFCFHPQERALAVDKALVQDASAFLAKTVVARLVSSKFRVISAFFCSLSNTQHLAE